MKRLAFLLTPAATLALLPLLFAADPTPTATPKKKLTIQHVPPAQQRPLAPANQQLKESPPAPTPGPKLKLPGATPAPTAPPKLKFPASTPEPTATPKLKFPGVTPTATPGPKLNLPGVTPTITPAPTAPPKLKVPGATPNPTAPPKVKIPGPTVTPTPKILIPPKLKIPKPDATPTPKILIPAPKEKPTPTATPAPIPTATPADVPAPPQLPPIVINVIPVFHEVHVSEVVYVPQSFAPVPQNAPPPPAPETAAVSPTGLRAWNGEVAQNRRAFDQTRVQLAPAADGSRNWQFYWQTTIPDAQAARWEIASMPFYPGSAEFPPVGLVAYGDASVDLETPVKENFFAVDFAAFEKVGEPVPKRLYMRVVPVNDQGEPAGEPSNAVRIDRP